jgi:hypothetical protein
MDVSYFVAFVKLQSRLFIAHIDNCKSVCLTNKFVFFVRYSLNFLYSIHVSTQVHIYITCTFFVGFNSLTFYYHYIQ